MKILVLMGGDSPERAVSLDSGKAVAEGLRTAGHEVTAVDVPRVAAVGELPELRQVDLVFPVLHGGQGEDGHLQAYLDLCKVPYALSGATASALAMDKAVTKRVMRSAGIPTPDWLQVTWDCRAQQLNGIAGGEGPGDRGDLTLDRILERGEAELGFPLVVKLNSAGSSVGVEIVSQPADFAPAFERVVASAGGESCVDILLERFVPGRELTAAILLGRRLPLLEIKPKSGFYDYQNKYTAGASEYLIPAPVNSPLYEQISADALRLFELIGCRGMARIDFRLDQADYFCLEINTIPGMTETSLVPKAAATVGIDFAALVDDLVQSVRCPSFGDHA